MNPGNYPAGLELTEDEAVALLGMCLTSPLHLDQISERALRKLAEFCIRNSNHQETYNAQAAGQSQATA